MSARVFLVSFGFRANVINTDVFESHQKVACSKMSACIAFAVLGGSANTMDADAFEWHQKVECAKMSACIALVPLRLHAKRYARRCFRIAPKSKIIENVGLHRIYDVWFPRKHYARRRSTKMQFLKCRENCFWREGCELIVRCTPTFCRNGLENTSWKCTF